MKINQTDLHLVLGKKLAHNFIQIELDSDQKTEEFNQREFMGNKKR